MFAADSDPNRTNGHEGGLPINIRDYEATRCSRGSVVFKNPIDLPDLPETRQMSLKLDLFVLPEILTKTPVKCRA